MYVKLRIAGFETIDRELPDWRTNLNENLASNLNSSNRAAAYLKSNIKESSCSQKNGLAGFPTRERYKSSLIRFKKASDKRSRS